MRIRTHKPQYTVISNCTAQKGDLSWEALGFLTYCLSMPEDWEFHPRQIWKAHNKKGGRDKVYKLFDELIENYHCIRIREKREGGLAGITSYEIFDDIEDCKKRIIELEKEDGYLTHGGNFKESFRRSENKDSEFSNAENTDNTKETYLEKNTLESSSCCPETFTYTNSAHEEATITRSDVYRHLAGRDIPPDKIDRAIEKFRARKTPIINPFSVIDLILKDMDRVPPLNKSFDEDTQKKEEERLRRIEEHKKIPKGKITL